MRSDKCPQQRHLLIASINYFGIRLPLNMEETPSPTASQLQQVDIRSVLQAKNPALVRILPDILLRRFESLVRVRDINRTLKYIGPRTGVDFARAVLEDFRTEIDAIGIEHLRGIRQPIIVSNHPLGGIDGVALIALFGTHYPGLQVPANDILMHLKGLRSALIPVNKHGSNSENLAAFNRAFTEAEAVLQFPAGLVSRKNGGRVKDLQWQKSFVVQARRTGRPVIPVYFDGRNSEFFYNLSLLRRRLHIKANIEMLFLVDEMFRQRGQRFRVTIGHAISPEHFSRHRRATEWADRVRSYVYRLAEAPGAPFLAQEKSIAV